MMFISEAKVLSFFSDEGFDGEEFAWTGELNLAENVTTLTLTITGASPEEVVAMLNDAAENIEAEILHTPAGETAPT